MQIAVLQKISIANNIMVLSPTGSGKTLPFLLACVSRFNAEVNAVQAIIVTPSRELALQIEQVLNHEDPLYKVKSCYGGHSFKTEQDNLSGPTALLIATPGRLGSHFPESHLIHLRFNWLCSMNLISLYKWAFTIKSNCSLKH